MTSTNQPASVPADVWAQGQDYEPYVGRWSRIVAAQFLDWLGVPAGARWLDVGCGTGALTQTILARAEPKQVKGVDRSAGFVAYAREQTKDPRAEFEVGDAQALPVEDGAYDAVVSALMLNFVPEPARAVAEMARAARADGTAALYVWDYSGTMEMMQHYWAVAGELDPNLGSLDEAKRFPMCRPEPLQALFEGAGLRAVVVEGILIDTVFRDYDDYWSPFLGGQGSAPTYNMAQTEGRREEIRERLRQRLPTRADGSIVLRARAWAVRGTR